MVTKIQNGFSAKNHNFGSLEFWIKFWMSETKGWTESETFFLKWAAGNFKNGSQKRADAEYDEKNASGFMQVESTIRSKIL